MRRLKEKHCYVAANLQAELRRVQSESPGFMERQLELPDGTCLAVGDERFRCAEALFRPMLAGLEAQGLHQLAYGAIKKCEVDLHRGLAGHVVLTGGTMLLPGMAERMQQELQAFVPPSLPTRVSLHPQPLYSAFAGGSIAASMSDMVSKWITREEYMEHGMMLLQQRCPCLLEASEQASLLASRAGG
eukprot:TRINITY_DN15542_c0_g1_i2.p1 TRINITY_DN15542_c0_g1~~TRINITY_DN15542_c0_g1_i2.p1  ORF type:complete len:188 (-),score=53.10 TRINITY_DN15542_c0_g1_i2:123-686(-)